MGACPTCGNKIAEHFAWDLANRTFVAGDIAVRLTRLEAKVLDAIWRTRHSGGIENIARFMVMVYGDAPDGGPESFSSIAMHLSNIRKRLAPTGWTIPPNTGSPRRGWKIEKLGQSE